MTAALKAELRAAARRARAAAALAAPEAAAGLAAQAAQLPTPRIVSGYWPRGSEIDPRPLMRALSARMALPSVDTKGEVLTFRAWTPDDPLGPDTAGIPAPLATAPAVQPDMLLVPLLAFDARGHRLGYGGGYYDRTLAALRRTAEIVAVGVAFSAQEVSELPDEPYDQRLDWIVTEAFCRRIDR